MKRAAICFLVFFPLVSPVLADELRLKDGTKIVGNIVGFEDNSFKVETSYGFALVRKDKVASISLAEPKKETAAENKKPAAAPKAAERPAPTPSEKPSPAPAEPPVREEVAGTSYVNHTYGFRMYKPPSWQVIEGARKMLPSAIVAMGTSDETTLLVMGREPLRGALEAHTASTEQRLREIGENYRALGEDRTEVAGLPAARRRFRATVDEHDWSGLVISIAHGDEVFTLIGMTYADSDLIQIQENVIAKTIASLEFIRR